MKKFVIVGLMTLLGFSVFAQEPLTYTDVVKVENVNKDDLYNRAKLWFTNTYRSSKDVLQTQSKEDGQLVGKAIIKYSQSFLSGSAKTKGVIRYSIQVFTKDGRYKYKFTDFIHDSYGDMSFGLITADEEYPGEGNMMFPKKWRTKVWKDIKSQINGEIPNLIDNLKSSMNKKAESENDDW